MSQTKSIEYFRDVCKKWLDGVDLCELRFLENGEIYMGFIAGGTEKVEHWVDICCRGVHVFNFAKDPEDSVSEGIFVGEARIFKFEEETDVRRVLESSGWTWHEKLPKEAFQFEVEGSVEIKIICTEFNLSERKETVGS